MIDCSVDNIDKLPFSNNVKGKIRCLSNLILKDVVSVEKIILFGSYARAQQTVKSDIDIMVITREPCDVEIKGDLCSIFDENGSDLIFYTNDEFEHSNSLLTNKIRKDGVLLWMR